MRRKYLVSGAVALAFGAFLSGCVDTDTDYSSIAEAKVQGFQDAYVKIFGPIAANQDWGFGSGSQAARTRSITVNGDTYSEFTFPTADELAAAFPSAPSADAREVKDLTGNLYFVWQEGHEYKVTSPGTVELGGSWANDANNVHNVYIDVDGDVTIKRNGAEHLNIYVIHGNVTIDGEFGECGGIISVASGATVNDPRNRIAHNDGIKVYNRGTYNATNTSEFDINNNCLFYNEATFVCTGALKQNTGSTSRFIIFGDDATVTAPSLSFNSNCHFYSDGVVTIAGETNVTQSGIVWVNNGHFTTGTMKFSANNGTFYNYCQLIVKENCWFLDGQFNMMDNSYAELGTGLFKNFHVVMGNNSGFNILNGAKFERQGGDVQGFYAKDDKAVVYVRIGGQMYVPVIPTSAFHVQGANLTFAYNSVKFYKSYNTGFENYSTFDGVSYWDETNEEKLKDDKDGDKIWNLHNVTKVITGSDFASTGFTKTPGQCAATWSGPGGSNPGGGGSTTTPTTEDEVVQISEVVDKGRIFCEDIANYSNRDDYDYNDVVFDAAIIKTYTRSYTYTTNSEGQTTTDYTDSDASYKAIISLLAAGGTLPISVGGELVHNKFGVGEGTMINTVTDDQTSIYASHVEGRTAPEFEVEGISNLKDIPIVVRFSNSAVLLQAEEGKAPHKMCAPIGTRWLKERTTITKGYLGFERWSSSNNETPWNNFDSSNLYPADGHTESNWPAGYPKTVTLQEKTENEPAFSGTVQSGQTELFSNSSGVALTSQGQSVTSNSLSTIGAGTQITVYGVSNDGSVSVTTSDGTSVSASSARTRSYNQASPSFTVSEAAAAKIREDKTIIVKLNSGSFKLYKIGIKAVEYVAPTPDPEPDPDPDPTPSGESLVVLQNGNITFNSWGNITSGSDIVECEFDFDSLVSGAVKFEIEFTAIEPGQWDGKGWTCTISTGDGTDLVSVKNDDGKNDANGTAHSKTISGTQNFKEVLTVSSSMMSDWKKQYVDWGKHSFKLKGKNITFKKIILHKK